MKQLLHGWCLGLVLLSTAQSAETLERFEYNEPHMGAPVRISVYAADRTTANQAVTAAYRKFADLNRVMSDYDSTSELMRLCAASGPGRPVKVSDDLFRVLSAAQQLSERTDGAFDVTVGPLTKLWRRARRRHRLPDPQQLAEARELVGYRNVHLDPDERTVELLKPEMRIDLGGIAMGYAADEAMKILKAHGITRALIDASGDILVSDPPPSEAGWKISLDPVPESSPASIRSPTTGTHLLLQNIAVTTSGDAFQHIEIDGVRYSHIVDPHTGLGLTDQSSVTVIAPTCMAADSLASTVSVLGPERGLKLVEQTKGAQVRIVRFADGQWQVITSRGFDEYAVANE